MNCRGKAVPRPEKLRNSKNESMKHKANRTNVSAATESTVVAIHELPLQKDLPEGWIELPMNNVCTIILGQSPPLLAPASNGPTCRRNMDPFSRFLNDSIISEKGTHPLVQ
jgi:hypothetical protein